jgi:hypothetical protein
VTNALKLARIIAPGVTPEADEANDGLTCLQSLYDQWFHNAMFGALEDVYLDADDVAEEGKRYYIPAGFTLTPATSDYLDSCGNVRQPRDLSVYESFDGATRTVRLYDRTQWVDLLGLTLNSTAPLSARGEMGLAACLAISGAFAAMFGDTATLNPDVRRLAQVFTGQIMDKSTTQNDPGGVFF